MECPLEGGISVIIRKDCLNRQALQAYLVVGGLAREANRNAALPGGWRTGTGLNRFAEKCLIDEYDDAGDVVFRSALLGCRDNGFGRRLGLVVSRQNLRQ